MKRLISLMLAVFMVMSVAPLSLAVPPMKDAELNAVLNAEGSSLEFINDAANPWIVAEKDGVEYVKSTIEGQNSTSTSITTTVNILPYSKLSFDCIVSSETYYDMFVVQCITGTGDVTTMFNISGEEALSTREYTFAEQSGVCVLRWTYTKDSSQGRYDDCVYLRNISIEAPAEPESISIAEDNFIMMPNMSYTLNVAYEPVGSYAEVEWESSNDEIATVRNGKVKAISYGDVTITARYGDMESSIDITVTDDVPYVDGFRAREYGDGAREPALVRHWLLGDGITFSQDLKLPNAIGDKVNFAKSAEYYDGILYADLEEALYAIDIQTGSSERICNYGELEFIYELSYDYANNRMLAWVCEDTTSEYIGEVDLQTGEITLLTYIQASSIHAFAVAPDGTAYVILRPSGDVATIDLTTGQTTSVFGTNVGSSYTQSITFDHDTGRLYWAAPTYWNKSLYEIDLENQNVKLIESNAGSLAGLHIGAPVEVVDTEAAVTGITLDQTELTVEVGRTGVLVATVEPENAENKDIVWESENDEIATVQYGVVTGVSEGTTTITARTVEGDFTASCEVTVIEAVPVAVTGVTLDRASATLKIGRTLELSATVQPANAANKSITWDSSNEEVATVTDGVVEAVAEGNAVITVTTEDGGFTANCEITVPGPIDTNVYPLYQDFEDGLDGWTFIDADGDSYNWMLAAENNSAVTPYEGDEMIMSRSYLSDAGGLDPDNWMISPAFTVSANAESAMLSWIAGSQMTAWTEHYSVYIASGDAVPETFPEGTKLFEESVGNRVTQQFDITSYAGQTIRVAFRHHESYDKLALYIDMIKVEQVIGGDVPEVIPVTGVTLDRTSADMTVGDTLTLTATVSPANATNKNVTWTSSNNAVATVNNGVVTAVAAGSATITVTTVDGGYTYFCMVTVTGNVTPPNPPAPSGYLLYEDFEDALQGWTILDADGDGHTWMSMFDFSEGGIASYQGEDMITSQSYINGDQWGSIPGEPLNPDNWLISPEFTIPADASAVLTWMAGSQDPDWPDHYSVYIGSGAAAPETFTTVLYTGDAPGEPAIFTADLAAYAGQTVRVAFRHHDSSDCYMLNLDIIGVATNGGSQPTVVPVTGVTLNTTSADMAVGDTMTLTATVTPENATNKNVTWSSSNDAVATVENGVVTAVAVGTATITVTTEDGGFEYFCVVTVTEASVPVTGVTLDVTEATMNAGETLTLTATVLPANATNKNVIWSTSNEAVATVVNGVVTAVAPGTATITVATEDGGFTAVCAITVAEQGSSDVPVEGVTLNVESAVLIVGVSLHLTATVMPENATNTNVVWTTSDESVATVEDGVVTAVAYGTAIITVTTEDGAFSATCEITVYQLGDVTGDGQFNTGDAVAMLRKIAGLDNSSYIEPLEDYNCDGQFNTGDAVAILRKIAGLA